MKALVVFVVACLLGAFQGYTAASLLAGGTDPPVEQLTTNEVGSYLVRDLFKLNDAGIDLYKVWQFLHTGAFIWSSVS